MASGWPQGRVIVKDVSGSTESLFAALDGGPHRTDSTSSTLHRTLARDGRFDKVKGCHGYWALVSHP